MNFVLEILSLPFFKSFMPTNSSPSKSKVQYFYPFKTSYDATHKASEMFVFFAKQCNQNKTFEKPRMYKALFVVTYEALNE